MGKMIHGIIVKLRTSAQDSVKRMKNVGEIISNTCISQKFLFRIY